MEYEHKNTNNKLDELLGIAELSKPYAYTNVSTSNTIPTRQVLLTPIVQSPINKPLIWAGLAPMKGESREVHTKESPFQWFCTPQLQLTNGRVLRTILLSLKHLYQKIFIARMFLQNIST